MIRIWLIRHGMTEGNKAARYIGTTDEALCKEGIRFLKTLDYPLPEAVYASPLLRCLQTAEILFPKREKKVIRNFSECDFGDFENKNYQELSGNPDYQAWIDSGGTVAFPGGESREAFRQRSLDGFEEAVFDCIRNHTLFAAFVIHGGTIMNIMENYADCQKTFYDWHVKNGGGYEIELEPALWESGRRMFHVVSAILEG